jgi:hypothetical protein
VAVAVTRPRTAEATQATGHELSPADLVLAAAAATTTDELAVVRMAAIRSGHLLDLVVATPAPDQHAAGVWLLGGLQHSPDDPQRLAARIGRITRRARRPPTEL